MLDTQAHPNILSAVLANADRGALLALRGASTELRQRADRRLATHLHLVIGDVHEADICSNVLTAPHGRLPAFMPSTDPPWFDIMGMPCDAAIEQRSRIFDSLTHTRILDVVVADEESRYGAVSTLAFALGMMELDTLRQFPNVDGALHRLPMVGSARTLVIFMVKPPSTLLARRWRETGTPLKPYELGSLDVGVIPSVEKVVVHVQCDGGIGPEVLTNFGDVEHTVFVLNSYRNWLPSFHRKPIANCSLPDKPRPSRKYVVRHRRQRREARKEVPQSHQDLHWLLSTGFRPSNRCTVVNLAGTPVTNFGFNTHCDPSVVEASFREMMQAMFAMEESDPVIPQSERRAMVESRLAFLSLQEYADTLTPREALDEGVITSIPGESTDRPRTQDLARPRHFLPRPRVRPPPRVPAIPSPTGTQLLSGPEGRSGAFEIARYPHIAEVLVNVAPVDTLLPLRAVCRHFRGLVDKRFARHLIIERAHKVRGRISSPLGPVPAFASLDGGPIKEVNSRPTSGRQMPPLIETARIKDLLSRTRVLDFNGYTSYEPYFDDIMINSFDLKCLRTYSAWGRFPAPFPAETLVRYHVPGPFPRETISLRRMTHGCRKVVHHIFPFDDPNEGIDPLTWYLEKEVTSVVVVFTPFVSGLCHTDFFEHNPTSPEERRSYLVQQLAAVLDTSRSEPEKGAPLTFGWPVRESEDDFWGEDKDEYKPEYDIWGEPIGEDDGRGKDKGEDDGWGNDKEEDDGRGEGKAEAEDEPPTPVPIRSLTLVNAHLIPHAWLDLPADWQVEDLVAEVRALLLPAEGEALRCITGEEYAAELSPDELEMEGTIEAVPGLSHRLLPHLQMAEGAVSLDTPGHMLRGRVVEEPERDGDAKICMDVFPELPFADDIPPPEEEEDEDEWGFYDDDDGADDEDNEDTGGGFAEWILKPIGALCGGRT